MLCCKGVEERPSDVLMRTLSHNNDKLGVLVFFPFHAVTNPYATAGGLVCVCVCASLSVCA